MNIDRLRNIIAYSATNKTDIDVKVKEFYAFAGLSSDKEILNILQISRPILKEKGYFVMEIPFHDEEIGALCYKGDAIGYIVLNTSLPKVNINFTICHELYHVFFQEDKFMSKIEFADNQYFEREEEFAANLFAGMLLMPESSFRFMYNKFKNETDNNEKSIIFHLMNYYQAPYMAVLIRCCELGLLTNNSVPEELLNMDTKTIKNEFADLWLDYSCLEATKKDDYLQLESLVSSVGKKYVEKLYLNERTLSKVVQNMRTIYKNLKGE